MLLDAQPVWLPHVEAGRRDPHSLAPAQLLLKELIESFFLRFPSEPDRLRAVEVAHHRTKLLLLPQVDLVYAHLRQHRLPAARRPPLQIAQVDRSHGARRQAEPQRRLPRRRTVTPARRRPQTVG